jgi:hypothetical protein
MAEKSKEAWSVPGSSALVYHFIESLFLSLLRYNLSTILAVVLASRRSLSLASSLASLPYTQSTASLTLQSPVRAFLARMMCWVTSDRSAIGPRSAHVHEFIVGHIAKFEGPLAISLLLGMSLF